jgi:hypothetical protein
MKAFPVHGGYKDPGMDLRDWFAGMALVGLFFHDDSGIWTYEEHATFAYDHADAMMAEREKKDG